MRKDSGARIETIEAAAERADPQPTVSIFNNRTDSIVAQALRILGIVLIAREWPRFSIAFY